MYLLGVLIAVSSQVIVYYLLNRQHNENIRSFKLWHNLNRIKLWR